MHGGLTPATEETRDTGQGELQRPTHGAGIPAAGLPLNGSRRLSATPETTDARFHSRTG